MRKGLRGETPLFDSHFISSHTIIIHYFISYRLLSMFITFLSSTFTLSLTIISIFPHFLHISPFLSFHSSLLQLPHSSNVCHQHLLPPLYRFTFSSPRFSRSLIPSPSPFSMSFVYVTLRLLPLFLPSGATLEACLSPLCLRQRVELPLCRCVRVRERPREGEEGTAGVRKGGKW